MPQGFRFRFWLAVILVVGCSFALFPSLVPEDVVPQWLSKRYAARLKLGLDLQGGTHLVLGVDVDKAMADKAHRVAEDLKEFLRDKKFAIESAKANTVDDRSNPVIALTVPAPGGAATGGTDPRRRTIEGAG